MGGSTRVINWTRNRKSESYQLRCSVSKGPMHDFLKLGSVAGPVIQANKRMAFEVKRSAKLHYTVNQRPH